MNVLLIGGGGREHALAWKLAQSPRCGRLYCVPGNPGIAAHAELVALPLQPPFRELIDWARDHGIGLTVVGPEAPLADGIVDAFVASGLRIFGPTHAAARLESSKAFAKDVMLAAGVPTGQARVFTELAPALAYVESLQPPIVVKADGLAAGKGVTVAATRAEALTAVRENLEAMRFGNSSASILIEEYLEGREVSVFALCGGMDSRILGSAEDHKRLLNDDRGPNTGGMGAFAPSALLSDEQLAAVNDTIVQPVMREMARRGTPFQGILYVGIILTKDGPRVLEFNCRFGDPETQVVLPLLDADLLDLFDAAVDARLPEVAFGRKDESALCVVMAAAGYPESPERGKVISGLREASELQGVEVFHAGTRSRANGDIETHGGRVLAATGIGATLDEARRRAYAAVGCIEFSGAQFRQDIGLRGINDLAQTQ